MNVLRYGLMGFFLIGYTYDLYTNSETISNQSSVIPTTFSVKDAYVRAQVSNPASILKKGSKPKVEGRRISIAPQASTRRISNAPETSDFEHVPVDYGLEKDIQSNVNFNLEPKISELVVERPFRGHYHGGHSVQGEKFGPNIPQSAIKWMNTKGQNSGQEANKDVERLTALYSDGGNLGRVIGRLPNGKWVFKDYLGHKYYLSANDFDTSGDLTFDAERQILHLSDILKGRVIEKLPFYNQILWRDSLDREYKIPANYLDEEGDLTVESAQKILDDQESSSELKNRLLKGQMRYDLSQQKKDEQARQIKEKEEVEMKKSESELKPKSWYETTRTRAQEAYRRVKDSLSKPADESYIQSLKDVSHGL